MRKQHIQVGGKQKYQFDSSSLEKDTRHLRFILATCGYNLGVLFAAVTEEHTFSLFCCERSGCY